MNRAGDVVSREGDAFLVIRDPLEGFLVVATCNEDGSLRTVDSLGEPAVRLLDPETVNPVGRVAAPEDAMRLWRRLPEASKEKVRARAREMRVESQWGDLIDRIKEAHPEASIRGEVETGRLLVGKGSLVVIAGPRDDAWDVSWADSGTKEAGFKKGVPKGDARDSVMELLSGSPLILKEWGAPA